MIHESTFERMVEKAKKHPYSSMNYVDFKDCQNAEVLFERDDLILLRDNSKTPAMLYFATDRFEALLHVIADMPGALRLHFIPHEYAPQLEKLGFVEWGEYLDFFHDNLADTLALLGNESQPTYLKMEECEEASMVSQKCRLQSRGFEGESKEWFVDWLSENKVIILRKDSKMAGFCCVCIYNEGTTLWIRELAVAPKFQGIGLGKKLLEQALRYGVENGAVKGFLAADVLNQNAIGLYEKYGFRAKEAKGELQMIRN